MTLDDREGRTTDGPRTGGTAPWREATAALIAQARADRDAFGLLYDLYVRRVYAFCALRSATREEAEDLTALTFERALTAIGRYEDQGRPFSSWLLQIAANAAVDRARQARRVPVAARASGAETDAEGLAEAAGADDEMAQWVLASWLRTHVAALPYEQRRVVQLRFYEGCSFAEAGARIGRSEGAAKKLMRRALITLRVRIHAEDAEGCHG